MGRHAANRVSGVAHHTGRIDLVLGVHDLRRCDVIFVAAVALRLAVTPFAADARQLMDASKLFLGETVVTRTTEFVRDKSLFLTLPPSRNLAGLLLSATLLRLLIK
jgi:hypothetical protein